MEVINQVTLQIDILTSSIIVFEFSMDTIVPELFERFYFNEILNLLSEPSLDAKHVAFQEEAIRFASKKIRSNISEQFETKIAMISSLVKRRRRLCFDNHKKVINRELETRTCRTYKYFTYNIFRK